MAFANCVIQDAKALVLSVVCSLSCSVHMLCYMKQITLALTAWRGAGPVDVTYCMLHLLNLLI